ncbi:phosphatase PAP2 family protein [Neomicrococcus aestuarii]|uniref:Phosphatidic acid phosphatase type 2/haloperoxidase domain-containing protein n=1 Tax=Neomicrococcus aestuarii TaxID=556325 RepID=A0A1L2ZNJ3_9MICC|nr:phosphatase PAP2 family protein [Neomicrococcus aestuarii]APF40706.1 hypothetical protein BHE16_06420 [Neomicrococcus aestuarii]
MHQNSSAPSTSLIRRASERVATWLGPYTAMWLTIIVGGIVVVGLTKVAAEIYESIGEHDGAAAFDQPVLQWMIAHRSETLDQLVTNFTNIGGQVGMPILALVVLSVLTWKTRSWRPFILLASVAAGSVAMTIVGKQTFDRARPAIELAVPPYETSPSFPSGHTLNATAIMTIIAYLVCLEVKRNVTRVLVILACALFVVAMGLSRVFLGHHWLTDVLAAFALGFAWAGIVILAHRVFHSIRKVRIQSAKTTTVLPSA